MVASFYTTVDSETFDSTELTAGPWSPELQHAGPPSALLVHAFENFEPRQQARLARVSVDVLSAVPITRLKVDVSAVRSGRNVELLEGTVTAGDKTVLHARAWRLTRIPDDLPPVAVDPTIPAVTDTASVELPGAHMDGYMSAVDWRFVVGGFLHQEPSSAWLRPKVPLIDDDELTPWQRTMIVADSGSGVHLPLNPLEVPAVNCDLSVALERDPVGEWIGMEASTSIIPHGGGTTHTVLNDATGRVGAANQVLFVRPAE